MSGTLAGASHVVQVMLKAKPLAVALMAGGIQLVGRGYSASDAVTFGALAALSASVGDVFLHAAWKGGEKTLDSYSPNSMYVDGSDFVAGGATMGLLLWSLHGAGDETMYGTVVAAVAAGTGPKLAGAIAMMLSK